MSLAALIPIVLKLSLSLLVLGLGLRAAAGDAVYLCRRPKQLGPALLGMFVIMPIIAIVLARGLGLHPAVRVALVALAISPLPATLPQKALKQGGKISYTVGLLVAATLLSIPFIPVALELIQRILAHPLQMRALTVLGLVSGTLLLPLTLGIVIRRFAPAFAERASKPITGVATVLLLVAFLPILLKTGPAMVSLIGNGTLLAMVLLVLAGLAIGHALGGPETDDRTVLAISTATRHPGIAVAIAQANFPDQKLVFPALLLYVLVSGIASLPYLRWVQRRSLAGPSPARA